MKAMGASGECVPSELVKPMLLNKETGAVECRSDLARKKPV
jgi:hypothetical protein